MYHKFRIFSIVYTGLQLVQYNTTGSLALVILFFILQTFFHPNSSASRDIIICESHPLCKQAVCDGYILNRGRRFVEPRGDGTRYYTYYTHCIGLIFF